MSQVIYNVLCNYIKYLLFLYRRRFRMLETKASTFCDPGIREHYDRAAVLIVSSWPHECQRKLYLRPDLTYAYYITSYILNPIGSIYPLELV